MATVQFCPPRPSEDFGLRIADLGLHHRDLIPVVKTSHAEFSNPKSEIRNSKFLAAPVAQLEERDASNVEVAGSSPARSSNLECGGLDAALDSFL